MKINVRIEIEAMTIQSELKPKYIGRLMLIYIKYIFNYSFVKLHTLLSCFFITLHSIYLSAVDIFYTTLPGLCVTRSRKKSTGHN